MYATVEQANEYFETHYGVASEWEYIEDDEKLQLLNRATLAIDSRFGRSFRGDILTDEQPNLFPRTEFTDGDGRKVPEGTIPVRLIRATAELALLASQDADVFGSENRTGIQSESVTAGSVSTTVSYTNNGSFNDETGLVSVMLAPLLSSDSGSSFSFGTSTRG